MISRTRTDATCPSCGAAIPLPAGFLSGLLICPECEAEVAVAGEPREPRKPSVPLPPSRTTEKTPVFRGKDYEDWVPHTPAPRSPGFQAKPASAAGDPAEVPEVRRRDWRKEKYNGELTQWEEKPQKSRRMHRRERVLMRIMIGGVVLLAAALVTVIAYKASQGNTHALVEEAPVKRLLPDLPDPGLEITPKTDLLEPAWTAVRKFATAETAADLLPFIRDRKRVEPLLLAYYTPARPWQPMEIRRKPDSEDIKATGNFAVLQVEMGDFSRKNVALEMTPAGFLIDWESLVGYSGMDWAEMRRTRPVKPVLIRAIMRKTDYANNDFPDEKTHRCYQLSDLGGENVIYGYVPTGTALDLKIIQTILNSDSIHVAVRVRYPENSTDERQVEITDLVQNGWVIRPDDGAGWPVAPGDEAGDSKESGAKRLPEIGE